ncbi:MAG: glucoamylase family protein [Phycisphaerales bacterium]
MLKSTIFVAASGLMPCLAASCATMDPDVAPSVERVVIEADTGTPRPPFVFSKEDQQFLDEIQYSCFKYFWDAMTPLGANPSGMVPDRSSITTVSVAGVGFQLSAICIGVERKWVTRDEAQERVLKILRTLDAPQDNKKAGLFFHFIDGTTGGQPEKTWEHVVSTIDSALLFAGVLTASEYFGGEVKEIGDRLFTDADWSFFVSTSKANPTDYGFVSLGWKPNDVSDPTGAGNVLKYCWVDAGDEHRLVTFLGVCAPTESHRVPLDSYYRLRRKLGDDGQGPMVYFPWSGALFTDFFAHCWMDYAGMGPDDPLTNGVRRRSRVDWWENARRHAAMHRRKAIENPLQVPTLAEHAWGLTASDYRKGYLVPGLYPTPINMPGAREGVDYPEEPGHDNYGDGTIAPYGAGSTIMFDPQPAIAALRYYRSLRAPDGSTLVWKDPATGGYGFRDAFNLGKVGEAAWVGPDYLAIDQGPLMLAIENARTGFVWKLFHSHPFVQAGMSRLGLEFPMGSRY